MLLLITSEREVFIITDLRKYTCEGEPLFVEKVDPNTHLPKVECFARYEYVLKSNGEIIFNTPDKKVRDRVAEELIIQMVENSYQDSDIYVELNDLLYNVEKQLYEENNGQTFDQKE